MNDEVPQHTELRLPTLQVLHAEGGSAPTREIVEGIAELLELPEAVLEVPHGEGPQSELNYQSAWARTHLKWIGAVENSSRGVWTITDDGRDLLAQDNPAEFIVERVREYRRSRTTHQRSSSATTSDDSEPDSPGESDEGWRELLLAVLKDMPPDAFERLCRRVLLESGFTKVEVTGQSGDGGIDGVGLLRIELISFQIVFQCKRYTGSVGSGAIREFRGSWMGRADKGLFLTTGRFSRSAQQEAVRDGAVAIDLIDGEEFCQLLKQLKLGVNTEMVEDITIEPEFFAKI